MIIFRLIYTQKSGLSFKFVALKYVIYVYLTSHVSSNYELDTIEQVRIYVGAEYHFEGYLTRKGSCDSQYINIIIVSKQLRWIECTTAVSTTSPTENKQNHPHPATTTSFSESSTHFHPHFHVKDRLLPNPCRLQFSNAIRICSF